MDERKITIVEMVPPEKPEGQPTLRAVKVIKLSAIARCRYLRLDPAHYRDDGTCRCDEIDLEAYERGEDE